MKKCTLIPWLGPKQGISYFQDHCERFFSNKLQAIRESNANEIGMVQVKEKCKFGISEAFLHKFVPRVGYLLFSGSTGRNFFEDFSGCLGTLHPRQNQITSERE